MSRKTLQTRNAGTLVSSKSTIPVLLLFCCQAGKRRIKRQIWDSLNLSGDVYSESDRGRLRTSLSRRPATSDHATLSSCSKKTSFLGQLKKLARTRQNRRTISALILNLLSIEERHEIKRDIQLMRDRVSCYSEIACLSISYHMT